MSPHPLIVTVPPDYAWNRNRQPRNQVLYTLALISPPTFYHQHPHPLFPGYHWPERDVFVVNRRFDTPISCFLVRCSGKPISFKRRPELRFPWAYGAPRTSQAAYGHFVSLDGETWDQTSDYAPYRLLSSYDPLTNRKEPK